MGGRVRRFSVRACLLVLGALALAAPSRAQSPAEIQQAVDAAYAKFKTLTEGKNADYIPALAKVDPNLFGIAVVTADGKVYTAGDVQTQVSIQSISKVFTMAQVIQEQGLGSVENRIGVDATGARFNSIIAVEGVRTVAGTGAPEMNPLVNPGAISATSMVTGTTSDAVWQKIIGIHNDAAGRELSVLQDVYKSESDTNQRNQAIGALMLAYGYIKGDWRQAVDLYTRQCSIGVNAKDLATMAATLAAGGTNPVTGKHVIDTPKVPGVLAVMSTAGLYDDSGKWLYHTGLPAKSGVGGGIIAVSPGKFGIAVVSPPLDDAGNSVRAQRAIADISNALGGNPYAATVAAQAAPSKTTFEIYGFAMLDIGQNFKQINPNWSDTLRVTKLPIVRRSVRARQQHVCGRPSEPARRPILDADRTIGDLKTTSSSSCSARASIRDRPRSASATHRASWVALGAGSTWSPFMDPDVFPNSLGVPGVRPVFRCSATSSSADADQQRPQNLMLALSAPARAATRESTPTVSSSQSIKPRFPLPDFPRPTSTQGAGATSEPPAYSASINWDDVLDDAFDLSGDAVGWGWNLSSNLKSRQERPRSGSSSCSAKAFRTT